MHLLFGDLLDYFVLLGDHNSLFATDVHAHLEDPDVGVGVLDVAQRSHVGLGCVVNPANREILAFLSADLLLDFLVEGEVADGIEGRKVA